MEFKDLALGGAFSLLGLLAGGGLYGLYVSQTTRIVHGECSGYSLLGECMILKLNTIPDQADVAGFEARVEELAPPVLASLTVAGAVSGIDGGRKPLAVEVNEVLRSCV